MAISQDWYLDFVKASADISAQIGNSPRLRALNAELYERLSEPQSVPKAFIENLPYYIHSAGRHIRQSPDTLPEVGKDGKLLTGNEFLESLADRHYAMLNGNTRTIQHCLKDFRGAKKPDSVRQWLRNAVCAARTISGKDCAAPRDAAWLQENPWIWAVPEIALKQNSLQPVAKYLLNTFRDGYAASEKAPPAVHEFINEKVMLCHTGQNFAPAVLFMQFNAMGTLVTALCVKNGVKKYERGDHDVLFVAPYITHPKFIAKNSLPGDLIHMIRSVQPAIPAFQKKLVAPAP